MRPVGRPSQRAVASAVRRLLVVVLAGLLLALAAGAATDPAHAQTIPPPPAPTEPATPPEPDDRGGGLPFLDPAGIIGGLTAQLVGQIHEVINSWFRNAVANGLNPTLELLSHTLLATPDLTTPGGRAEDLWWTSLVLANSLYVLLIMIGGVVVMSHQSLQTQYALKDVAPRLVAGLVLANSSLLLTGWAIELANALSGAFLTSDIDPGWVARVLGENLIGPLDLGLVFLVILVALVLLLALGLICTYVVRVAVTILLIVAAPLALACHALPQTEGIARLWWRAFTACLLVQVAQSLTLITTVQVLLVRNPQQGLWLGLPDIDLVGIVVTGCLFWVLQLIPLWAVRAVFTRRTSTVVRLARTVVVSRALGRLGRT